MGIQHPTSFPSWCNCASRRHLFAQGTYATLLSLLEFVEEEGVASDLSPGRITKQVSKEDVFA